MKTTKGRFPRLKRIVLWSAAVIPVALFVTFVVAYARSTNACDDPPPPAPRNPMKAFVYCGYGSPDVLKIEDIEKPTPADNEVLVKVRAVSVNPYDWHFIRGTPYFMRLMAGLRKPKDIRLGVDFAGTVEAVGRSVTQFKPGDEVFGGRGGAFAEYLRIRANGGIARKPPNITFEQAAGVNIAGMTALQSLRNKAQIRPGQKILINGASGGVGTFMVQIAKTLGAEVTGVCSTRNVNLVRTLGADHVVDYTKEDYTQTSERYDAILDNVGNRSLSENRRVLKPEGKYILIGGGGPNDRIALGPLGTLVKAFVISKFVSQEMGFFLAQTNQADLNTLGELMQAGKVTPVIDRRYNKLTEIPDAVRYLETGRARGKVVITIDASS